MELLYQVVVIYGTVVIRTFFCWDFLTTLYMIAAIFFWYADGCVL